MLVTRGEMVPVMRVRGDAAGESRDMKHLSVSDAEKETEMKGIMQ